MANSRPPPWEECFRLISQSRTGREVLSRFLPEYHSGKIELREVEEGSVELLGLRQGGGAGTPAGGFTFDAGHKRILLVRHPALGIQAPLLFHEMVHATDEEFLASFGLSEAMWKQFRTAAEAAMGEAAVRLGKADREVTGADLLPTRRLELIRLKRKAENFERLRIFRTERKAYSALYVWIQEVCGKVPEYRDWLARQRSVGFDFDREISDDEIVRGYELQAAAS